MSPIYNVKWVLVGKFFSIGPGFYSFDYSEHNGTKCITMINRIHGTTYCKVGQVYLTV